MKIRKVIFTTALSALVCFGLCQQVQSATDTPDPGSLPTSNTADGQGALGSLTTGLYNSAFGFLSVLSLSDANFDTGVGAGALLVDNGGENTAVGDGGLFSNTTGTSNTANVTLPPPATPPWGPKRSKIMTTPETAKQTATRQLALRRSFLTVMAPSTTLSAPLRSLITLTDSATTLLATPRFSLMLSALKTPPLVMSRSRLMTLMEWVWPTTTQQLAVRRSSITLMAVRTQPWGQGQDQTWSRAPITLTSATSSVPSPLMKAVRSASATFRTGTGPGP